MLEQVILNCPANTCSCLPLINVMLTYRVLWLDAEVKSKDVPVNKSIGRRIRVIAICALCLYLAVIASLKTVT
jgi:hypothetical protein